MQPGTFASAAHLVEAQSVGLGLQLLSQEAEVWPLTLQNCSNANSLELRGVICVSGRAYSLIRVLNCAGDDMCLAPSLMVSALAKYFKLSLLNFAFCLMLDGNSTEIDSSLQDFAVSHQINNPMIRLSYLLGLLLLESLGVVLSRGGGSGVK